MKKLVSTTGLSEEEWLAYRKRGIGGSDAGAVCGLNPYSSPMNIYQDKISDEIEKKDNEAMRLGRDLEDYVAQRFMEETGLKVRKANAMFYDEENPFMLADVDRLIVGEKAGLECKTVNAYSADKWENGNIPPHYQIQCYHYMAVLGLDAWYIAALIFGKGLVYHKILRDESVIKNLRSIEKDFWQNHVEKKNPPEADGSDAFDAWIKGAFPKADAEKAVHLQGFDEELKRRMEVAELIKKLTKEKNEIEQKIKVYMGNAESAENENFRVYWKNIESNTLDTARLKEEMPDVYKKYSKISLSRRFTVKAA